MDAEVRRPATVAGVIDACRRCSALAASLDAVDYARSDEHHSSIGDHVRHALEYLQCAVDGIEAGAIDYDARRRDHDLASFRESALAIAQALAERAGALRDDELQRGVEVHETVAPGRLAPTMTSTVGRELGFAATHAVHHVEIACRVAELHGIQVPPDLGLACSTAAYLGRDEAGGRA